MRPTARPGTGASPIQDFLDHLHARFAGIHSGAVATYIPELAKADPAWFGIVVATVDGQVYEVGDTRQTFTIQSVSKPLAYGMALEDQGRERVLKSIGVEPSGDAFNSISLEPGSGRPLNPMINAGAIATASLIRGDTAEQRLERLVGGISAYAGRPLTVDEAVFESERATGHRNRAIGHMLRNYDIVADDPEAALELYFKQCSVLVNCRDLGLIAATLANGGVNPVTAQRAVKSEHIAAILSVMTTCGMYDFSGEWVYRVGMPAKSGVGGGIVAVLPGQLGIGIYSPLLDERGNSVRGVKTCEALSAELGLHFLQPPRPGVAAVRARYSLASMRSKRRRLPDEARLLDAHGPSVAIYELQGDLRFATIEPVLRSIADAGDTLQYLVLDFKRVSHADDAATRLLAGLAARCASNGQHLLLSRVRRGALLSGFSNELDPRHARAVSFQPALDSALEWCERHLLARLAPPSTSSGGVVLPAQSSLADHRWCAGVSAEDIEFLASQLEPCHFDAGSTLVRRGEPADALYFLLRGEVSVVVELPQGGHKRLSTLSAGMGFGEAALIAGGQRSADVRADSPIECCRLRTEVFKRLEALRPALTIRLLHNLLQGSAETAARLTQEVAALEG